MLQTSAQAYRGLYVNDLSNLLNDDVYQYEFLKWVEQEDINSLSIYDLHKVLDSEINWKAMGDFIIRCRAEAKVTNIVAVVGGKWTFTNLIEPYQEQATPEARFDAVNMELEWWVGKDHFQAYVEEMEPLIESNLPVETYIGWFGKWPKKRSTQSGFLVNHSDIVTVHAYQKRPSFHYVDGRLEALNDVALKQGKMMNVVLILSMEERYSGRLSTQMSYNQMYQELLGDHFIKFSNIKFLGWKVFCYTEAVKYRKLKNDN